MPHSESTYLSAGAKIDAADSDMIVHGLWIGNCLSRMELLTLHSFTHFGHQFHLWVYDDLDTPVPRGVSLHDANEIIPRERAFMKSGHDVEVGLGKNSYAPFSDLFRYKLLYEHGGIWVDMDVSCHRRFDFSEAYVFRAHPIGMIGNVMKVPAKSELMRATYEEVDAIANADTAWLTPNRILNKHVSRLELASFIRCDISNVDRWMEGVRPFVEGPVPIPDAWYCIHWMNEAWKTMQAENGAIGGRRVVDYTPSKDDPFIGGTLRELYRFYGLIDPRATDGPASPTINQPTSSGDFSRNFSWYNYPLPLQAITRNLSRESRRSLAETVSSLASRKRSSQMIYAMDHVRDEFTPPQSDSCQIVFRQDLGPSQFLRLAALGSFCGSSKLTYTYDLTSQELTRLHGLGLATIPVVETALPAWHEPATVFNDLDIPFILAGADTIAQELVEGGCTKPIITLRHEVPQKFTPDFLMRGRGTIRGRYGIDDETVLVGLIGAFRSQMAYTRAVRILAALQKRCRARLMIIGKWESEDGKGRRAYDATMRQAVDAGVIADVIVVSSGEDYQPYLGAFDVLLNTSVYEGLNLILSDAVLAGCPVVAADVGGNRGILTSQDMLVEASAEPDIYVDAIAHVLNRRERILPAAPMEPDLIPRIRALLLRYGANGLSQLLAPPRGTLFLTASLHIGGPARSLVNLLSRLSPDAKNLLCVLGGISVPAFQKAIEHAQVPLLSTGGIAEFSDRIEQVLIWVEQYNVKTICFWNVPPETKLLLTKILFARNIRIVDVSPGPMLFDELDASTEFQKRISLTTRQYLERLDQFVSLYQEGTPQHALGVDARASAIIPLGVAQPPRFVPLPPPEAMPPVSFDPRFAIGTCCRVVPDKKIDFLFDMMKLLVQLCPLATLTIVGGPDRQSMAYWESLLHRVRDEHLDFVHFVGRHDDVNPFLNQFKVFVMVSERQGCPNASLEAMVMKRPVVANPSGGTAEQIVNGLNGYLVETPEEMASRVAQLLDNPAMAKRMGQAGYEIVTERFGLDQMVDHYEKLLM